jgi:hypothetical protein
LEYWKAKAAALSIQQGFVIDEKIKTVFKELAFYFTNNPEFEKQVLANFLKE